MAVTACDIDEKQLAKARDAERRGGEEARSVARAANFVIIGVGYDDEVNGRWCSDRTAARRARARIDHRGVLDRQARHRQGARPARPHAGRRRARRADLPRPLAADEGTLLALVGGRPEVVERGRAVYRCFAPTTPISARSATARSARP